MRSADGSGLCKWKFKETLETCQPGNSAALTLASAEREQGVKIFLRSGVHEIVRRKNCFQKRFHFMVMLI